MYNFRVYRSASQTTTHVGPDAFFYVGLEGSPTRPNPHAADTAWRLYPLGTTEEVKLGRYENQEVRLPLPQGVKVDICGLREIDS